MLDFSGSTTVYLACGCTDLRKSYTGLAAIIKLKFHLDPYSRCMFAFCNRRRTLLKILQWDGSGFWNVTRRSSYEPGFCQFAKSRKLLCFGRIFLRPGMRFPTGTECFFWYTFWQSFQKVEAVLWIRFLQRNN